MLSALMKWHAANEAEAAKAHDERSFCWRAGYYEVILTVVVIIHGPEAAMKIARDVLSFYGETFADYSKEFSDA
jgi:hypothetical protein